MRGNYGLTQDELADQLDVSRQTIISLEKERYNPSITLAFKLSRIFSCTIEDIFIYEED
ncbi:MULTISPECIES: helix-turn-helix transcriptional regulator [Bacillaceae]|uniref:Transcriptional regulator n=1 Tax=Alkalicoccobacillus plakortidis TaxID=444060 RepID=A0A9D5I1M8_9BACI|nr:MULTISPECIES: helix-turn-helix transcriptional regulator [Bacillaceae]KQL58384.1 transcriptional regulator [Alkalicoccobacillus plakortidis]